MFSCFFQTVHYANYSNRIQAENENNSFMLHDIYDSSTKVKKIRYLQVAEPQMEVQKKKYPSAYCQINKATNK